MSSGASILLLVLASVVLLAIGTVAAFRFVTKALGLSQLVREGIEVKDHGIELLRFFWLGKRIVPYGDIESVEVVPFHKSLISTLTFRYGFSTSASLTRSSREVLVLKLKSPPRFEGCVILTPRDPAHVAELVKSHMKGEAAP